MKQLGLFVVACAIGCAVIACSNRSEMELHNKLMQKPNPNAIASPSKIVTKPGETKLQAFKRAMGSL